MSASDPTQRFTDRVDDYARHRPGYPAELIRWVAEALACPPPGPLLDIGAGTGLLTRPLLEAGYAVTAVEPNHAMRAAGERALRNHPAFTSVAGTAEDLPVAAGAFAAIVAAQAFHWFDPPRARQAFARALQPGGWAVLIWNNRRTDTTPFLRGYEAALQRHCPDYAAISATHASEAEISAFFAPSAIVRAGFENLTYLDRDAVRGRLLSSSYVPKTGPAHEAVLAEVDALFEAHADAGRVEIAYETVAFAGRLG